MDEDADTDQASIRPVSSLRSLFEKKPSNDSANAAIPYTLGPKLITNNDCGQDGHPAFARASLDIPRTSSPWSISESAGDSQRRGTPGPPLPRPRRPNSKIIQRPLSTNSLSAPCSPPLVTIDSPNSPPKVPISISMQPSYQLPAPRQWNPVITRPPSMSNVTLHPERLSRSLAIGPQSTRIDDRGGPESISTLASSFDRSAQNPPNKRPPVVSRGEKPKVPAKPPSIHHKARLEPLVSTTDERLSPFSTPPSSDEGGDSEAPQMPKVTEAQQRVAGSGKRKEDKPHQSTTVPSIHVANQVGQIAAPSRTQKHDAREFGFASVVKPEAQPSTLSALPGAPPGLPPRRGQHQRVASTQRIAAATDNNIVTANVPLVNTSKRVQNIPELVSDFLPPPKRAPSSIASHPKHLVKPSLSGTVIHPTISHAAAEASTVSYQEPCSTGIPSAGADYPDISNSNRRPPLIRIGVKDIDMHFDTRLVDICGRYVATAGHVTRVWDISTGDLVLSIGNVERDVRVTSLAFKPAATADDEGSSLWLGNICGDIQEVHIPSQDIMYVKIGAHERRDVIKIYRHQSSMWTLDDGGKLCVWAADDTGLPDLRRTPISHRVPKGHTCSLIVQDDLWLAAGKEISIFRPSEASSANISILSEPLCQANIGAITSGAILGGQLDRVYFGHADGKVTMYSTDDYTCLGVVSVSVYRISCLTGAGFHLWAGYSTGAVYVYDTQTRPWTTKKDWVAHSGPTVNIMVDRSSLWKTGVLRVVSLGADNILKFWDGTLKDDWLASNMQHHDIEYCSFRELTALVVSWNAGATTPTHLRYEEKDSRFVNDMLQADVPPDLLVFGFQELVDLEDKKLTAKTFFKGNKKKDPFEQDHMSRQYRSWRDYLVRCIEDTMPSSEPYHLVHTASMVGLFSCVFIKASQRNRIRNLSAAEIKRGMGGLHGNKGALILRFTLDDSSICLVNCHLAAGQTQTVNRNNDITAILESAVLPSTQDALTGSNPFIGGGDGSMILDHEICILNGDMNYRIDTMGRDTVLKAIHASNLSKLLERDQLLVSRRRNPGFCLRAFKECAITFNPTYKYDVGSDTYDTSEKRRAPAWCDRILYRGTGKIKQTDYRQQDLRVSDHRPVTGRFKIRIKAVSVDKHAMVWNDCERRFEEALGKLANEAKIEYLRDILGIPPNEAKRLI